MTLVTLPDAESLVIKALLGVDELGDFGGRIYSVIPKERTFPLARVFRYGGDPFWEGDPYWIDQPSMQVDVWANGRPEALRLGELLRAACAQFLVGTWPDGVISSVRVSALVNTDDPVFSPSKPRYRFTLTMVDHPVNPRAAVPSRATRERLSRSRNGATNGT